MEKLRKKFIKKRSEKNEHEYRKFKKEYKKILKNAKNEYFINKLKIAENDPKKTWKVINEALQRKPKGENHQKIIHDDKKITDSAEIADILSQYYKFTAIDKIKKLKSEMNFEKFLSDEDKRTNKFKLEPLSIEKTWLTIRSIVPKSSSGFDGMLMYNDANWLAAPLQMIINKCFKEGMFPTMLKLAKIHPVDKRKGPPYPCNFRPVSLLSCFSKVLEKSAMDQLVEYTNKELTEVRQFAYCQNHNTEQAVLLTRHLIETELKKEKYVCLSQLDLTCAFDCIQCDEILPKKIGEACHVGP